MITHLYSYNPNSVGAKSLAAGVNLRRIKHNKSRFKGQGKVVLNWGATQLPYEVLQASVLNKPGAVEAASNKLKFFELAHETGHLPAHTVQKEVAIKWLREGKSVVCRTILNGSGGRGIVLVDDEEKLIDAPLYVQYVKKKEEYRIHFWNDKAFDFQRKARRLDHNNPNWRIRNHNNGFIFQRQGVELPDGMEAAASEVFGKLGLDFGAIDTIYNEQESKTYVLEVNTAPGLEGQTLDSYIKQLSDLKIEKNYFGDDDD